MTRFLTALILLCSLAIPSEAQLLSQEGTPAATASFYHPRFHGRQTASGETYDQNALTAAHNTLPFHTMVRVTRLDNGRSVVVRINDRMAPGPGHTIDLSTAAANRIGLDTEGITSVRIDVLAQGGKDSLSSAQETRPRVIGWSATPVLRTVAATNDLVPLAPSGPPEGTTVRTRVESPQRNASELTFTLQIGSFSSRAGAEQMARKYETAWIAEVTVNGVDTYRVYYSRFEDEAPARLAQQALWKSGQDSFLRRVNS